MTNFATMSEKYSSFKGQSENLKAPLNPGSTRIATKE
jgi:hypothetical protein